MRFQFLNAEHLDVKIAQSRTSPVSQLQVPERLQGCWHPSSPISVSHRVYFTSKGHAVKVPQRIINYSWKYIPANGTYNYFNY